MDVVAQWVRTWWSTESRGGAGAATRSRVPIAFPLPEPAAPLVHEVTIRERDGFQPAARVLAGVPGTNEVDLREADGALRVMLRSAQFHNLVRRRPPAVRLRPGEWLRRQIDYRFRTYTGRGPWLYRLDTLNLAYRAEPDPEIFLGTPTRRVDERALR
ncbi:hypothetical protein [Amycolatopsis tucumanensis]|uniref:Uncharacterized protein n=1 Tax=Amycolatopsis tucumanensis TaxID=401106 RepID=A0ABP7ISW2_9PSEU|nr:hypothetical protein [Amycolatopsis tucumanensis]MCF6424660.1 hypothetical protein [Amycolatopsis tucumanensis]